MLKRISFTLVAIIMAMAVSVPVWADDFGLQSTASKAGYTSAMSNIPSAAGTIVSVALSGLALIFFALIVYAGVRWMTAHGNEEFVTKAKEILYGAIIGLILVLGSYALSKFVLGQVGIK